MERSGMNRLDRLVMRLTEAVTCDDCAFANGDICDRPATVDDCSDDDGNQYIYKVEKKMWDKNYRRLEFGEIIQDGDEVDSCRDPWRDEPKWEPTTCVGQKAPDPQYPAHRIYRRKISA